MKNKPIIGEERLRGRAKLALALLFALGASAILSSPAGATPAGGPARPAAVTFKDELIPFNLAFVKTPLNLYPGYVEPPKDPTVDADPDMNPLVPLDVFLKTSRAVFQKPASEVNLAQFKNIRALQEIDAGIVLQPLDRAQAVVDGNPNRDAKKLNWCGSSDLCLRSTFILPDALLKVVQSDRTDPKNPDPIKIFCDSEVFFYHGPMDPKATAELARLTGINTPIEAALVQNDFFCSKKHIRFGKLVAVLQPLPSGSPEGKSVLTAYFAFGLQDSTVKRRINPFGPLVDTLMSRSPLNSFAAAAGYKGLPEGLPVYTKEISEKIYEKLK
jgi:hypothetical protein